MKLIAPARGSTYSPRTIEAVTESSHRWPSTLRSKCLECSCPCSSRYRARHLPSGRFLMLAMSTFRDGAVPGTGAYIRRGGGANDTDPFSICALFREIYFVMWVTRAPKRDTRWRRHRSSQCDQLPANVPQARHQLRTPD